MAGARKGREGYGKREKKWRETGSLRWGEAGVEIQKVSFRYFVTAYIQSKKRTQQRPFPFNVLWGLKQNFIREKGQKTKIRTSYEIGNLPIRHEWDGMTHVHVCGDCVSRVSVSSVSLAVEILRKNDKASQVKCRQVKDHLPAFLCADIFIERETSGYEAGPRPFWSVSVFLGGGEKSVHGRPSWELAPYDCSSQNTEDFAAWCKLVSKECRFNDRAGEGGVVRFTTQFFISDWRPKHSLPIRIRSQTVWFTW